MSYDNESKKPIHEETIEEESSTELSDDNINIDNHKIKIRRRQTKLHSPLQPIITRVNTISVAESNVDEEGDEDKFDLFILDNFTIFSGTEDVISWLDKTDKTFNQFKISRNLRYKAIPLLVGDAAKRTYILNKSNIKSFDDLYECLLINYYKVADDARRVQPNSLPYSLNQHDYTRISTIPKNLSYNDQQLGTSNHSDDSDSLPPRPILRSTTITERGATRLPGDDPTIGRTFQSRNLSHTTCSLDQTRYVIHKAIIDNLIKNPKTFQGGKEDVKQWLEDIEQLFDTAQIPDGHKLDLIPYSLRGEARRWYKKTKSSLVTWSTFVKEIKEAFLSPFHDELAFKKLESYTQGINQPVRSFYNEVLKLCTETDSDMSESMKLRHLLKKAKPTLQYEIRKRKPTTTKQFLEYAKEAEELLQLSNIDTAVEPYDHTHISTATSVNPIRSNIQHSRNDSRAYPPYDHTFNYDKNRHNNNYGSDRGRTSNSRFISSDNSGCSFNSSFQRNNSSYPSNRRMNYNQQYPTTNPRNINYTSRSTPSNTYSNSTYSQNYNNTNSNPNQSRTHAVNHITTAHTLPPPQLTRPLPDPDIHIQDSNLDNQPPTGPRF